MMSRRERADLAARIAEGFAERQEARRLRRAWLIETQRPGARPSYRGRGRSVKRRWQGDGAKAAAAV